MSLPTFVPPLHRYEVIRRTAKIRVSDAVVNNNRLICLRKERDTRKINFSPCFFLCVVYNVFVVVLFAYSRPKSCLLLRAGVPRLFNEIAFRLIGGVGPAGRRRQIICARWLLSCCSTSRIPLREKKPPPKKKPKKSVQWVVSI